MSMSDPFEWWEYDHKNGHKDENGIGCTKEREDQCPFCNPLALRDVEG